LTKYRAYDNVLNMPEFVKDADLINDDPPFHSSTSPGGPIPSDLRVAGFDKRKTISALVDKSREATPSGVINTPENITPDQEPPASNQ
jgi:hypothetical protein